MADAFIAPPITPASQFATARGDEPRRLPLTRQQFYLLYEAGLLPERCELIDGEIREKVPQRPPHTQSVRRVERILRALFGEEYVFSQTPLVVDANNEPEPDVFVTTKPEAAYTAAQPPASEARLVVEVSDATVRFDLGVKAGVYASAGIPEYWVVDLNERRLHVYRVPVARTYTSIAVLDDAQTISPLAAPQAMIALRELLP